MYDIETFKKLKHVEIEEGISNIQAAVGARTNLFYNDI